MCSFPAAFDPGASGSVPSSTQANAHGFTKHPLQRPARDSHLGSPPSSATMSARQMHEAKPSRCLSLRCRGCPSSSAPSATSSSPLCRPPTTSCCWTCALPTCLQRHATMPLFVLARCIAACMRFQSVATLWLQVANQIMYIPRLNVARALTCTSRAWSPATGGRRSSFIEGF